MSNTVTEIVTMKCSDGISKEDFIKIIDNLECQFHSKQDGFMDTELLYDGKENSWIMIQHWTSAERMKAASKKMFQDPATEQFRSSIDPKQVKISVYPILGTWCSNEVGA